MGLRRILARMVDAAGVTDGYVLTASSGTAVWASATGGGSIAASSVTVTPTGGISSTNAQAALAELDTEKAPLASPALTGTPTAPTVAGTTDSTTKIATTAFVQAVAALFAPLASPTFTGDPKAPTPTAGDNDTSIATTAFVATSFAPLASPALTGNPTVPTQAAGTNSTRAASTAYADNAVAKQSEVLLFALSDETTGLTTGTKVTFRMPFAFTISQIRSSLTTASTSGLPTVDVKKNGTSVFSTLLTIDANEKTSQTAATAAVLSTTAVADDDEIAISVTVAGTGAAGLKVTIIGVRA